MSDRYLTDQVIDILFKKRIVDPGEAAEHRSLAEWKKWIKEYVLEEDNNTRNVILSYARGSIIPGFFEALDLEALKKKQAKVVARFEKEER